MQSISELKPWKRPLMNTTSQDLSGSEPIQLPILYHSTPARAWGVLEPIPADIQVCFRASVEIFYIILQTTFDALFQCLICTQTFSESFFKVMDCR